MGFKIQENKQVEQIRMKIDVERVMSNSRNIDNIMIENSNIYVMMGYLQGKGRLVQG